MSKCNKSKEEQPKTAYNGIDDLIHWYEERINQIDKSKKKNLKRLSDIEYDKFHKIVRNIENSNLTIKIMKEFIFNIKALNGDVNKVDELINFYKKNCEEVRKYRFSKESELQKIMNSYSNPYYFSKQEAPEEMAKCLEDCLLKERLIDDFIFQIVDYTGE